MADLSWDDLAEHEKMGVQITVGAFFSVRGGYAPKEREAAIAFYRQQYARVKDISDFTMARIEDRLNEKIEHGHIGE
jgi:hypothetical protein